MNRAQYLLPTHSSQWVTKGDRCVLPVSGWTGLVLRVVQVASQPHCVVRWDHNGHTGRVLIAQLRKVEA